MFIINATPTCVSSIFPEEIDYRVLFEQLKEAEALLKKEGIKFKNEEDVRVFYNENSR